MPHRSFQRNTSSGKVEWSDCDEKKKKFERIMSETLQLRGTLLGHNGWVTQIATNPKYPDMILSSSRGKHFI